MQRAEMDWWVGVKPRGPLSRRVECVINGAVITLTLLPVCPSEQALVRL